MSHFGYPTEYLVPPNDAEQHFHNVEISGIVNETLVIMTIEPGHTWLLRWFHLSVWARFDGDTTTIGAITLQRGPSGIGGVVTPLSLQLMGSGTATNPETQGNNVVLDRPIVAHGGILGNELRIVSSHSGAPISSRIRGNVHMWPLMGH